MVNMVFVRLERTSMLFDTCETHSDGVKQRDCENAYGDRRGCGHVEHFRHFVIRVYFAEMENESREQIAQKQTAGVPHENLLSMPEYISNNSIYEQLDPQ